MSAVFEILLKAALSVRAAGRQEIGLDDLLDAFESSVSAKAPGSPEVGEVFVPIPHQDVPLSPEAVAALASARRSCHHFGR